MFVQKASIQQLAAVAREIINPAADSKVFMFFGDMGAGKTTFIKSICYELGVTDAVSSPTFSIINEYASAAGPVYHFDFYRLASIREAYDLGLDEYLYSGSYCLIEWPEKIKPLWPDTFMKVNITVSDDQHRRIEAVKISLPGNSSV